MSEQVVAYRVVELGEVLCPDCALLEQEWVIQEERYDTDPTEFDVDENGILMGYHQIRPGEFDFEPMYEWELDEDWECG